MTLDKYITTPKNLTNPIETKFKSYNTGNNQSKKKQAINEMEDYIVSLIEKNKPSIGKKFEEINNKPMSEEDFDDVLDEMFEDIETLLLASESTEIAAPSTPTQHWKESIQSIIPSGLDYNGQTLGTNVQVLLSKDFVADSVQIKKGATIDVDEMETDIKDSFPKLLQEGMPKHVITNLKQLTKHLRNSIQTGSKKYKVAKYDLHLDKVFGSTTRKYSDEKEREAAYEYWEEIWKSQEKFISRLKELVALLKEGNPNLEDKSVNKDVKEFILFCDKNVETLRYIIPFEPKRIELKKIHARGLNLLVDFAAMFGHSLRGGGNIVPVADTKDDVAAEDSSETAADQAEGSSEEGGEASQFTGTARDDPNIGAILPQSKVAQITELIEEIEDAGLMDPLGIIVIKEDLKDFASLYGEIEEIKAILEKGKEKLQLDEDDEDAVFEDFVGKLEHIREYSKEGKLYLPMYVTKIPILKTLYRQESGDISGREQNIDRFLELFAKLIEQDDDKTSFPQGINLDMLGASRGGKTGEQVLYPKSKSKQPRLPFAYVNTVRGRKGSPRQNYITAGKKNSKIVTKINSVVKLMEDLFLDTVLLTRHNLGIDIPFSDNAAMRIISTHKKLSPKYAAFSAINRKLAKSGEALIGKAEAKSLTDFTDLLTEGDSIKDFENLKRKARVFAKAVYKIFKVLERDEDGNKLEGTNKAIRTMIHKEVASIIGSIQVLTDSDKDKAFEVGSKWSNTIKPIEQYNSLHIEEVKDMSVIRILTQLLTSSKAESIINAPKTVQQNLVENFKELAKSEINAKLLSVHDTIRLLKKQPIYYSRKNVDKFEHLEMMINKMEKEYHLDISASEITSIVSEIDSFNSISKAHGISTEHVYLIKANFR